MCFTMLVCHCPIIQNLLHCYPIDIYASAVLLDTKSESTSEGSPQSTVFPSGYEVSISLLKKNKK